MMQYSDSECHGLVPSMSQVTADARRHGMSRCIIRDGVACLVGGLGKRKGRGGCV
jgi:hypothetical protein